MELLSVIRRWHFRDKLSIRDISRRTNLSRNTIRKYLRSDGVEPKFKVPDRPSKLDPFADRLSAWLKSEASKPRKQKRTMKQLHADLLNLGYDGSYCRVAAFALEWKADWHKERQTTGRGTFVPLAFDPGEAFQFDWSEDWAIIGNERTKLQVAHTKLAYSRAFVVRAYLLQTHEMLFDAHNHAFRVFGGIPRRGIYDNMKTAIDKVGRGKDRDVNVRFQAMASHYLFEPEFCNPASGWEKGQVEKNVQDARHRFFQPIPRFASLDALNEWLETRCKAFWVETPHGKMHGTIADLWAEEARSLMPVARLFDGFVEYVDRHRSVLLRSAADPGTFFVKTVKTTSTNAAYDTTSFYEAWRHTIQRYGIYNPYTGRGAIKGLLPHGPHNVRDVLATHILKHTGSYEQASYAIQDTAEMVAKHYGRFLPQDKAALAARILNQVWEAA